ncbi:MAG: pseudouridine synthase [Flavobacteriales bacterium]
MELLSRPIQSKYTSIMAGRSSKPSRGSKKSFSKSKAGTGSNKYTPGSAKYAKPRAEKPERDGDKRNEKKSDLKEKKVLRGSRGAGRAEPTFKTREESTTKKTRPPKWPKKEFGDKPTLSGGPKKEYGAKPPFNKGLKREYGDKPSHHTGPKKYGSDRTAGGVKKTYRRSVKEKTNWEGQGEKDGTMRLNKFLSNAGIASRRDADELIKLGLVKVNGVAVTELGLKVDPRKDTVLFEDRSLKPERLQYVLLNKPKDFITTMDDEKGRNTVMTLVESACKERIYPVGRLDRNTTGLLLFTNDGELAKRLTHPRYGISKLYHIELTSKVNGKHLDEIREGVKLEDGFIKADEISFVNDDPYNVGIRIHSGKNRIVRRIFEHYGYTVKKLDRVIFAGLTKKDLPRGRYRHLTENEVNFLRMIR